ncbi:GGDEF domain-containing protein [Marinomonas rhizomae]|uniref:diguanylate cyclase n=1 Tax=Marinomonas rhizomae TaxID=491948 RepID=A0A366IXR0_9GAMM|nr:GGDEF domain-containing protein [Marinomonas rhizomae]RBP79573.1 diguanylate cyclase (GGDEF)-like protein [Marinomonas rhizomae]RNF71574.1 GGDEF domain-containing protein [Marinomonas rhizomae]
MFNWLNVSMTRKISSLSFVLLSFLFVVILYSTYQTQKIYKEMQEVAEIDIPLSEVIADIEILQLKQHLLMEGIRLQGDAFFADEVLQAKSVKGFDEFSQRLSSQLDKSVSILHAGMSFGSIRIDVEEHQSLIQQISVLHKHRIGFESLFSRFLKTNKDQHSVSWEELEKKDNLLDSQAEELLANIERLTMKVAATVEKQERDFMVMNAILGVSAFAIGGYLTLYTILSFRRKVGSLRGQIESLHRSISSEESGDMIRNNGTDELDQLEKDLKVLMARFSLEQDNRDEVETQLMELATKDKLTGVFNRHKWDEQIKDEIALANRGHHFSLVLLDIDHFKKINDSYGHDMGDYVLKLLVNSLRKRLRETDMLFRIGGEEFVVLLRDTNLGDAEVLAEQLRKNVEVLDENDVPAFTISLGVTDYQDFDDQGTLVKRADILLYEAKGAGRNRVMAG